MSRSFGEEGPVKPHLARAGRGREIGDLREDADRAFTALEAEIDGTADPAALSALPDEAFPDGKPLFVASLPGHVRLVRGSSAPLGAGVFATSSGQGRWLRVSGENGANGEDAFSIVAMGGTWTWEGSGQEIALELDHIGWLSVGQVVHVSDGVNSGRLVVQALGEFAPEFPNMVTFINDYPTDGPAGGTVMQDGAKVSPAGTPGTPGAPGVTGPQGPTTVSVKIDAALTTSQGAVRLLAKTGPLTADKLLPANSIKFHYGTGYSASDSSFWMWQPGYVTPGSPGTFTAIGAGRANNVAGGACISMSTETYTHPQVTIPAGAIPAVVMTPTNFPSANAGLGDTIVEFFRLP